MTENSERIRALLLKYSSKASTKAEEKELFTLLNSASETDVEPLLTNILENTAPLFDDQRHERILASVLHSAEKETETTTKVVRLNKVWKRIAVAASIVGLLFVGYWLLRPSTSLRTDTNPSTVAQGNGKAPDKNRAQITLADGTTVYLDSAGNGSLASQGGVRVVKTADGKIIYETGSNASTSLSTQYNTASNPRGSKVMDMTLSDGSRVWLNAGSSVTYPIVFTSNERTVNINGEAYFEVAPDKTKPFKVSKGNMTVEVLGTHFNVNAYDDDSEIKVTLLEGSVEVKSKVGKVKSKVIKPGEQARVMNDKLSVINNVDVDEVMAWRNGMFSYNETGITEIMKQVARWYDLEVMYEGNVKDEVFSGSVPRTSNVNVLLKIMESTNTIRFELQQGKIIVKPAK